MHFHVEIRRLSDDEKFLIIPCAAALAIAVLAAIGAYKFVVLVSNIANLWRL